MVYISGGRRGRDRIVGGFTTTCAKVPITTKVVSSNPAMARCTRYNITDKVCLGTPVSSTNKTDRHDITEILLKVALNTINQNLDLNIAEILLNNHSINLPEVINIIR